MTPMLAVAQMGGHQGSNDFFRCILFICLVIFASVGVIVYKE